MHRSRHIQGIPGGKPHQRFVLSPIRFWGIIILILLFPLSMNWKLMVNGTVTEGTVVSRLKLPEPARRTSKWPFFPVVEYYAEGQRYEAEPPENVKYREGRKIRVLYHRDDPGRYMLLCFSGIFLDTEMAGAGIVLVLWLTFFWTYGRMGKPFSPETEGPEPSWKTKKKSSKNNRIFFPPARFL